MDLYNISPINIVDLYNIYISVNVIYYLYIIERSIMRSRIFLCVFGVSLFLFGLSRGYPDESRKNVARSTRFLLP